MNRNRQLDRKICGRVLDTKCSECSNFVCKKCNKFTLFDYESDDEFYDGLYRPCGDCLYDT